MEKLRVGTGIDPERMLKTRERFQARVVNQDFPVETGPDFGLFQATTRFPILLLLFRG